VGPSGHLAAGEFLDPERFGVGAFRSDEVDAATRWMAKALSSGAKSAHLFHRASRIFAAAWQSAESADYSVLAWDVNPHLLSFHVHR
jgi:hypothetical protein